KVERCYLIIEVGEGKRFQAMHRNRSLIKMSSVVCLKQGRADRAFGSSTNSAGERKVCGPPQRLPASSPAACHRPPTSIHIHAERSADQRVPECIARHSPAAGASKHPRAWRCAIA